MSNPQYSVDLQSLITKFLFLYNVTAAGFTYSNSRQFGLSAKHECGGLGRHAWPHLNPNSPVSSSNVLFSAGDSLAEESQPGFSINP